MIKTFDLTNSKFIKVPKVQCRVVNKKTKFSSKYLEVYKLLPEGEYIFEELDQNMIKLGKENKNVWFNTNNNKILYKSIFEDDDSIKFKIINSKEFNTFIYDEKGDLIKDLNEDNFCADIVIEPVAIWIKDNKYGVYIRLHQIRVCMDISYILSDSSVG